MATSNANAPSCCRNGRHNMSVYTAKHPRDSREFRGLLRICTWMPASNPQYEFTPAFVITEDPRRSSEWQILHQPLRVSISHAPLNIQCKQVRLSQVPRP